MNRSIHKNCGSSLVLAFFLGVSLVEPVRGEVSLFDYGLNQDGVVALAPAPVPPGSVFDTTTGLGTVRMTFAGPGVHSGILFVDHEMSEAVNTFFNELGDVSAGAPPAGLSWEIDEPGFQFGDIFDNFLAGTLDNSVGTLNPEDVSMAMAWDFVLAPGETGVINFVLTETQPVGFYLRHSDPDSGENVYFAASLEIKPGGQGVPDGDSTAVLLLGAVTGLMGLKRINRMSERA
jgi:hypothetical protein